MTSRSGSRSGKAKEKLRGKTLQLHRQQQRDAELREIQELNKRIVAEAPPAGTNPLTFDDPAHSFVPDAPNPASSAAAAAAASSTQAADSSSAAVTAADRDAGDSKKNSLRLPGTVLFGAVRKFSELPISQRTLRALNDAGFTRLTDIQRAAIPHALAGRDVLGAARTGSGKTLAYLVPLLEKLYRARWNKLDGVGAMVIVPTRELAMQIFDVLRTSVGKTHTYSAGLVIGGKDLSEEQERILTMNILICTPGRILQHFEQTYGFNVDNLQLLVLDEADRILDMGFKQSMVDILSYLPPPPQRQTLLFSATLQAKQMKELVKLSLDKPEYIAVHQNASLAVPNKLVQQYTIIPAEGKMNLLYSFIKTHLQSKSIVFVSSGKQKMKQQKRMAIYYDFCNKTHALLFCTDLAARGLDFPDIDWVVQMDCAENVETYIHRVGRTARYRAGGKALLFLLPSELAFISQLLSSNKIQELKKVKADPKKLKDITSITAGFLAQDPAGELKFLAQKAFISYVRSLALQPNKDVFKPAEIDFDALAKSMGLIGTPKVKLPKGNTATAAQAQKQKNMPHALRELLQQEKEGKKSKKKSKDDKKQLSAVDRIISRKNTTVFSEAREKLRAKDEDSDASDAESDEDEILKVARVDHELSSDEEEEGDEEEIEMSSESGEEDEDQSESEADEGKEAASAKNNKHALLQRDLAKLNRRRGAEIATKSAEDAAVGEGEQFLSGARERLAAEDPQDRQREMERVRAKHRAKKLAMKKAKMEAMRASKGSGAAGEEEDDDEYDGTVVTLGRPSDSEGDDGDEDAYEEDEDGEDGMEDDGGGVSEEDEDESAAEEAAEAPAASRKRKGVTTATAAPSAPASRPSKKQKTASIPKSLADQEALALKILGQQR